MPVYLQGFGEYENDFVTPHTLNHVTQFLGRVSEEHWGEFRKHAKQVEGKKSGAKIKPSSYRRLETETPSSLIKHIVKEHQQHADHDSNVHLGGGIHEAISNVLTTAALTVGGKTAARWVGPEFTQKELNDHQKDMAELVQGTYKKVRPEHWENFMRIPEYDTRYGSLFVDTHGKYTFAVRGTKGNLRDLYKDVKIAAGFTNSSDDELVQSFKNFKETYPNAKVNLAGHSLGTELMFNAADVTGLSVEGFYAFNPASSPAQRTDHIDKNLGRNNAQFFLNANDVVSKRYLQNATAGEKDRIYMGKFLRSPLASHSLGQWL